MGLKVTSIALYYWRVL